jgi:hypothetical protein
MSELENFVTEIRLNSNYANFYYSEYDRTKTLEEDSKPVIIKRSMNIDTLI